MKARVELLQDLFQAAIKAAQPEHILDQVDVPACSGRRVLVAVGKAAPGMARVAQHRFGLSDGIVVTRKSQISDVPSVFRVFAAGHPVPDQGSLDAGDAVLELVETLSADDQLIVLISGGASAMLEVLPKGVSLNDLQAFNRILLESGLAISQMNLLRRLVSKIKAGGLAVHAYPAQVVTLALSDVPGDNIEEIGSGPSVQTTVNLGNARKTIEVMRSRLPISVVEAIESRLATPSIPYHPPTGSRACIVGSGELSLNVIETALKTQGYDVTNLGAHTEGDAHFLGREHAVWAKRQLSAGKRSALISGGETTVEVTSAGRGGRNKAYLLACAIQVEGRGEIVGLAGDSDGVDGSEADAGAWFDGDTLGLARKAGVDPSRSLEERNSYDVFAAAQTLIQTGPTGTNVNDIRIVLVDP